MTSTADSKKRVTLPKAKPGDIFDIEDQGGGRFLLTRLKKPAPPRKMTRAEVERGLKKWTAKMDMSWEELRAWTREI